MMIPSKQIGLKKWADSLILDFPADNVPVLKSENDWESWGNILIEENSFSTSGAPSPSDYDDWLEWAQSLYYSMANF